MTVTRTDPHELGYDIVAAMAVEVACAPPEQMTALAQQLPFYRDNAERRVRAAVPDDDGQYLAEALRAASTEVGFIYARSAGDDVANAAMIDLDETDYFGAPLSKTELAHRKRDATNSAKRLVQVLLAEPLDPATTDASWFWEGFDGAIEHRYRYEHESTPSPAVHREIERLLG